MPDEMEGGRAKKEKMNGAKQPGVVAAETPISSELNRQNFLLHCTKLRESACRCRQTKGIETEIASVKRLSLRRSVARSLGGRERKPVAVRKSVAASAAVAVVAIVAVAAAAALPPAELAGAAE